MNRVNIDPMMLIWARERAGLDAFMLHARFPKLEEWEGGEIQPTLRQLEAYARSVHVPIGYLFLAEPPQEILPIPDFRTLSDRDICRPSPNLLDTLYLCQERQDWFRSYAKMHSFPSLEFVGSIRASDDPILVAKMIRKVMDLRISDRKDMRTWTEALRHLVVEVEEAGVLVMASSVVGSNSHRKLDVREFRGFSLVDELAPLIFINAADSKSAQMFTLVHELIHLWLGESGVSDPVAGRVPQQITERWCNTVAAELLVPLELLDSEYSAERPIGEEIQRLARVFKVSSLVVLRRLYEAGYIVRELLWSAYQEELVRLESIESKDSTGGDFYRTLGTRTGKRFARAVLSSTLEGQTLFQDAFRMLGVRKTGTFYEAARNLGVML